MNEDEYRNMYHQVDIQPCVFEKITLLRYGDCEYCRKVFLAEREVMTCKSKDAQQNCKKVLNTMRENARFALKVTQANEPLPHSKELRVQAGGLFGLQQHLDTKSTTDIEMLGDLKFRFDTGYSPPINNIYKTVSAAIKKFRDIKNFPYTEIVKSIIRFKIQRRNKNKR
jgi:hypothetical protein